MGLLTRDERRDLIEMLLKLPNIYDAQFRWLLVQSLPVTIQHSISYSSSPRTDIETIITSADAESAQRADGTWPIVLVIEDAIGLVTGSRLANDLQQLLDACGLVCWHPPARANRQCRCPLVRGKVKIYSGPSSNISAAQGRES